MKNSALIISCEHAVNSIPEPYQALFVPYESLLDSHQGIDFGALEVALYFKEVFACDMIQSYTSRLLIDYNRSLNNNCFSVVTKKLPTEEKQKIINQYYIPYRERVISRIERHLDQGTPVIHLSIHSFTPVMNEKVRNAEVAFLYDPHRPLEKILAQEWQLELKKQFKEYRVKMNYPYKGISDGFITALRKKYSHELYVGIEIELNQSLTRSEFSLIHLKRNLVKSYSSLKIPRLF